MFSLYVFLLLSYCFTSYVTLRKRLENWFASGWSAKSKWKDNRKIFATRRSMESSLSNVVLGIWGWVTCGMSVSKSIVAVLYNVFCSYYVFVHYLQSSASKRIIEFINNDGWWNRRTVRLSSDNERINILSSCLSPYWAEWCDGTKLVSWSQGLQFEFMLYEVFFLILQGNRNCIVYK